MTYCCTFMGHKHNDPRPTEWKTRTINVGGVNSVREAYDKITADWHVRGVIGWGVWAGDRWEPAIRQDGVQS